MATPEPSASETESVRQIVGAFSVSEVKAKIQALDEATWNALQTDLSLWAQYRFDNDSKFKAGSYEEQSNPQQTRADYRNMYCSALGYALFNADGSRIVSQTDADFNFSVTLPKRATW